MASGTTDTNGGAENHGGGRDGGAGACVPYAHMHDGRPMVIGRGEQADGAGKPQLRYESFVGLHLSAKCAVVVIALFPVLRDTMPCCMLHVRRIRVAVDIVWLKQLVVLYGVMRPPASRQRRGGRLLADDCAPTERMNIAALNLPT